MQKVVYRTNLYCHGQTADEFHAFFDKLLLYASIKDII